MCFVIHAELSDGFEMLGGMITVILVKHSCLPHLFTMAHPLESFISVWSVNLTKVLNCEGICLPESSESLLSGGSSMSSSDISISSSLLIPISCSLWMFLISCKTQWKKGRFRNARVMHILAGTNGSEIISDVTF